MLETFKDFFDPFKERLKSHFYTAFIGSWLLVNWEIVLVTLTDIKLPNNQNTFDFIKSQTSNIKLILYYPIGFSLVYIVILPWIDTLSVYYKDWTMKVRSIGSKKILKDGFVSTDLYLKYREAYEEKLRQLEKYTGEQEEDIKKRLELERNISELEQKLNQEQYKNNESNRQRKDFQFFFRGRWELTFYVKGYAEKGVEIFIVQNDDYIVLGDNEKKIALFKIALFDEESNGRVSFLKYDTINTGEYRIVNIYRNTKNENIYEGTEIWYERGVLADSKLKKTESKVKYERVFETN